MTLNKELVRFLNSSVQDLDECLIYLLACRHNLKTRVSEETIQFLEKKNLIHLDLLSNEIVCTAALYEGESGETLEIDRQQIVQEEITSRVDEYRKLFKNIRSGSIGDKQKVISQLTRFCLLHNKTFDEVLQVTKLYMEYTEFKLISNADNFISKLDKDGKEVSLLLMAFEEQDMESNSSDRTYKMI